MRATAAQAERESEFIRQVEAALEELGRWRDALAAYQQAIDTDASFADAHFNLARLYDQLGRRTEAIQHLRAYKRLVE